MNVLICDDLPDESAQLNSLINELRPDVKTIVFDTPKAALSHIRSGAAVDVCVLDIIMPDMNGVELAVCLRNGGFKGQIVFLTTSNEYASESYAVDAFYYLIKPPAAESINRLFMKLDKLYAERDGGEILLKTMGTEVYVKYCEISHVEVIDHSVFFRMVNGTECKVVTAFGEIAQELLSDNRFVQCHRSYIINVDAVLSVDGNDAHMRCGANVPISRSFYTQVKQKFIARKVTGGARI